MLSRKLPKKITMNVLWFDFPKSNEIGIFFSTASQLVVRLPKMSC